MKYQMMFGDKGYLLVQQASAFRAKTFYPTVSLSRQFNQITEAREPLVTSRL